MNFFKIGLAIIVTTLSVYLHLDNSKYYVISSKTINNSLIEKVKDYLDKPLTIEEYSLYPSQFRKVNKEVKIQIFPFENKTSLLTTIFVLIGFYLMLIGYQRNVNQKSVILYSVVFIGSLYLISISKKQSIGSKSQLIAINFSLNENINNLESSISTLENRVEDLESKLDE